MRLSPVVQSLTEPLLSPLVSAITGVIGGGFNPQQFFKDGSIGVLYDNNDLTSFYLDAAGTTAAVVNGPVGLQLDKSQGLVLGAELVPTGDMSDITGWSTAGAGTTIAVVGGELEVTGAGGSFPAARTPSFTTVVGRWYKVSGTGRRGTTASSVYLSVTGGAYSSVINSTTSNQDLSFVFQAAGTSTFVSCLISSATGTGTAYFDNISVKELHGNHRYQTTTGSKPVLRGTPTGSNLVTNGDFASATGWTLGTGWSISGGKLNASAVTVGSIALFSGATIVAGRTYRIQYTISNITAGGFGVRIGNGVYVDGQLRSTNGTYVEYLTATISGAVEFIRRGSDVTGSIDDVDVRDVSAGSVTAPYGLQYDGVDDFMQTASVNFSATDKMFVCAGVRKLSDAAARCLVELSASVDSNNGSFYVRAPRTASPNYNFVSKGTIQADAISSMFAAPITSVVSGESDIASDLCRIRVNGVQVGQSASDQGAGNYGNYPLYFGRRGGINLPFNGLDFGFCIVGKTLTASQIASTERWIAQRTGVTL